MARRVDFQVGLDQIRKSWLVSDYLEKKIKFKGTLSLKSIELTRINLVWLDFDKVDKNYAFSWNVWFKISLRKKFKDRGQN